MKASLIGRARRPRPHFFAARRKIVMPAILLSPPAAPVPEPELSSSDIDGIGIGGVPDDPNYDPHSNSELDPDRWATPLSAYRLITFLAIIWIVTLFVTLTLVLESRWAQS